MFCVDRAFPQGFSQKDRSLKYGADLTSSAQVQEMLVKCEEEFQGLHAIVNSAGIEMKGICPRSLGGGLRQSDGHEREICIPRVQVWNSVTAENLQQRIYYQPSSDLGLQPIPGVDAYAASKGAIISLTKAMAKNWAKSGLRINCVAPGPIDTPLLRVFRSREY